MDVNLNFRMAEAEKPLGDYVYCFSSLQNLSQINEAVIIPNGKIDLIFSRTSGHTLRISLLGLETKPKYTTQEVTSFFAVSFNPLAIEYVFKCSVAELLNSGKDMPANFWDFNLEDLDDFDMFCHKTSQKIQSLLPNEIDERKRKLFELIFATNGEISIRELSEKLFWNSRQINRYFNKQFGLSLKSYCSILRFQASLPYIKKGVLFPQFNFTDQSHFIKEIKKLSGVSPKALFQNQNDRFLQFLVYSK